MVSEVHQSGKTKWDHDIMASTIFLGSHTMRMEMC
jgi:hypothetical protein